MSAPTSQKSDSESMDPRLLARCLQTVQALHPHLSSERLHQLAQTVARQTQQVITDSTTSDEFSTYVQKIKQMSSMILPPEIQIQNTSTFLAFEKEKQKILKNRNCSLGDTYNAPLEKEIDEEVSTALQRSIKKAQDLSQRSCYTCKAPDRLISTPEDNIQQLLKKCSRCKKVMYCSTECQRKDWPRHKKAECLQLTR